MPNTKHNKGHRHVHEDVHNNNLPNGHHGVNNRDRVEHQQDEENAGAKFQHCCVPLGCSDDPIDLSDPYDAVRVICNNEACTSGNWMHKDCFIEWEQSVLSFLRSCGRARSWSEKQRLQNLWTKKGYDLAYKACDCKCSRGHLRKDLDYIQPPLNDNHKKARKNKKKNDKPMPVVSTNHKSGLNSNGGSHNNHHHSNATVVAHGQSENNIQKEAPALPVAVDNAGASKKKDARPVNGNGKQRRGSDNSVTNYSTTATSTTTSVNSSTTGNHHQGNKTRNQTGSINKSDGITETLDNRCHLSLTLPKNNMPLNQQAPPPIAVPYASSQVNHERMRTNSMSSTGSVGSLTSSSGSLPSSAGSSSPLSASPSTNVNSFFVKPASKQATLASETGDVPRLVQQSNYSNMSANTPNSMFRRRQDLSAFCALPRTKQNPYNIHMEETAQDDDDMTRNFVLNSLSTKRKTGLRCVLCKHPLPVFDRFPLLDGTLFLSPQTYDSAVVQVIWEGRIQFLTAVCLGCMHGNNAPRCTSCLSPWDGRNLVVGTMYTYDVFAASPCCQNRLTCKHCHRAVVDVAHGLPYYSQYSRMILCPFCKANDYHFIRPLPETFSVQEAHGSICGSN